ncbi:hypothetical protein DMUE_6032 [Dictyocoela muelleri]|nr:hypothetical protein DMUE_6032 [Dictyocoela muelleri]
MQNFLRFANSATACEFYNYLLQNSLIKEDLLCIYCDENMILKKSSDNNLGLSFRCLNYDCVHYQTTRSVVTGSIFEQFNISPQKVLQVFYYLCGQINLTKISQFTGVGKRTLIKLKKVCLEAMERYFITHPIKLGGIGIVVHIDETMLNHTVRSHRGRAPHQRVWCLTMVDTSETPSKGYAEIVTERSSRIMLPIIQRVVRPGSVIHTDEWRAYNGLDSHPEYSHRKITHKYNFVDPNTGVHTQNVESFNNKLKLFIKLQKGCIAENRKILLTYFLFCDYFKEKAFEELLNLLKTY